MSSKFGNDKFGPSFADIVEKERENKELLEAIRKYQSCPFVHELTCGNDSGHTPLKGIVVRGEVILICPDCEYKQEHVPNFVWTAEDIEKALPHEFLELAKTDENGD